jgi:hypothetical protein
MRDRGKAGLKGKRCFPSFHMTPKITEVPSVRFFYFLRKKDQERGGCLTKADIFFQNWTQTTRAHNRFSFIRVPKYFQFS